MTEKKQALILKMKLPVMVKSITLSGDRPHLAALIVGNDGASLTYVGSKVKACEKVGFDSTLLSLPESISEQELLR